jgi:hypothetical protein
VTLRRTPARARLALGLALATGANVLIAVALIAAPPAARVAEIASIGLREAVLFGVTWTSFAVVGAVIVRHQPANAVGWLCSITGFQVSLVALAVGIATVSLAADPQSRLGVGAAWLAHTSSVSIVIAPLLIFIRFPTGQSLGGGWRLADVLVLASAVLLVLVAAVEPMPLSSFPTTPNPLAVGHDRRIGFAFVVVVAAAMLAVATLIIRFRRGSPLERSQLRLLAGTSVVVGAAIVTMPITSPELVSGGHLSTVTSLINAVAFVLIPATIGIAIVRNRLYDIDRIINRTLVYAMVSGVLVVVYAGAVLALSPVIGALAPGTGNTLVTAGSTLLAAALFRPVRARAQEAVDRRFDRQRYAAVRTIESFSGQVRTEAGLDAIVGDLVGAVGTTVHPATTGCWLRVRSPGRQALVGSAGQH